MAENAFNSSNIHPCTEVMAAEREKNIGAAWVSQEDVLGETKWPDNSESPVNVYPVIVSNVSIEPLNFFLVSRLSELLRRIF